MTCEECNNLLAQRMLGALDRAGERHLEAHLSTCFACAKRAEEYDALDGDLARLADVCASVEPPASCVPAFDRVVVRSRRFRFVAATRVSLAAAASLAFACLIWHGVDSGEKLARTVMPGTSKLARRPETRTYRTAQLCFPNTRHAGFSEGRPTRVPAFVPYSWQKNSHQPLTMKRVRTPSLIRRKRSVTHVEEVYESQDDRTRSRVDVDDLSGLG
ncbi:MAG: hypothetical protein PVI86_02140 [Phycisphaerae bacterium]|jgi:hypothetical protein